MASVAPLPEAVPLSSKQVATLQPELKKFKAYAQSAKFQQDEHERHDRVEFFQLEFPKRIPQLSEADLAELISDLWAAQIWGNKQYLVQQIVAKNGEKEI